ncbi:serine/threonine protein kinase [Actinoplanes sp. SE50]|uniref:protein kinase family protein n=1 Tax=unclassified Actinoplanes TaxID=2626549 RepID=UPI00023EDE18|nr:MULTISPECIES: protein kinase family protein [unclassified Actinoplanes]AEV89244.1 MAP/microtubule affinity-regulating kinase 3 [Actinoplanes sp. SE50/110]ATO87650.1 serine/threonine protein kinase [Actinoplanes sp. SE50]SLM05069.1 serine/threonine protein kinase [Actinoplanes sp. SE50/110]
MTQVGEGHETAADEAGPVLTFGEPAVGEILAERYQLEQHVNNDSAGRQVWRGIDVVLRRPVAVVLRHPGGDSATEMLQAAVAASRVIHPNLVGVYDAIDEQQRAYVVREWVDGESLRDLIASEGPLDPARAIAIAHSVSDALAAVHATGMIHGNVHPGTTLIGDDGRVVLADARADAADSSEADVRAVGGLLYFALTGRWPHAEVGRSALPDATRDGSGAPAAPRQARAGVPAYLDDLTMDLLDGRIAAPPAEALTAELGRLDAAAEDEDFEDVGPLRFVQGGGTPTEPARSTRKILVGVGALVIIAIVGLVFGIRAINKSSHPEASPSSPVQAGAGAQPSSAGTASGAPLGQPKKIPLTADMVRIVDPPQGERKDSGESDAVVDGNPDTAWKLSYYLQPNFGGRKPGMGVLIHLKEPRALSEVRVSLSAPGAVLDLRVGDKDPGDNSAGDDTIVKTYKKLSDADSTDVSTGDQPILNGFDPDKKYQYVLVFLTKLPRNEDTPGYQVNVNEIELYGY